LAEIEAIRDGWQSPVWGGKDEDRAVLRAVDELIETSKMSDETYDGLIVHFSRQQMMDLVFTIGNYVMLGWAVATFGIPVEEGIDPIGFDLKRRSGGAIESTHRPFEKN
jgi:alkylhydroperoxidase family enzyme